MSVWPQSIMLAFFAARAFNGVRDATKKDTPMAAAIHASGYIVASIVYLYVLYAGNFFASFGWPA
jgi:uncharacterized membrane protein YjjB (DUF3815 family)